MAFEVTTSLRKMLDMKARKKVIQGATVSVVRLMVSFQSFTINV
jgi:hypothetical protein